MTQQHPRHARHHGRRAARRGAWAVLVLWLTPWASALADVRNPVHAASIRAQRRSTLLEAWQRAAPESRQLALAHLRRRFGAQNPAGRRPPLEILGEMRRVLAGVAWPEVVADGLARFTDSIELRVIPGAFESVQKGRGRSLQVRVSVLYDVPFEGRVKLSLAWHGPFGQALHARAEPFDASAFRSSGFAMYVRAPLGPPRLWHLVPSIELGGRSAEGNGVPVEGVADLAFRSTLVDPEPPRWADSQPRIHPLLERGIRFANGTPLALWLERHAPLEDLLPGGLTPRPELDPRITPWGFFPDGFDGGRPLVVLLTPSDEQPANFALTSLGRWRAAFSQARIDLLCVRLGADGAARFAELRERIRREHAQRRIYVVARGDAVTRLHLLAAAGALDVNGIALVSDTLGPGPVLGDGPLFWIGASGGSAGSGPARPGLRVRSDARPDWMIDPDLPELLSSWIATL